MKEFIEALKKIVENELAADNDSVSVEYMEVSKMNQELHGLAFRSSDSSAAPVFYVDDAYEAYNAGVGVENIAKDIIEAYKAALALPKPTLDKFDFSFDKIKDVLSTKLLAKERNEEFLKTVPYKDVGNGLFLIAYLDLSEEWSAVVNNRILEDIGVDSDTLFDKALENDVRKNPAKLTGMSGMMFSGIHDSLLSEEAPLDHLEEMYVLTNDNARFGAICLFYPDMPKKIAKLLGCNYYAIPSSIHEWIILPDTGNVNPVMVKEMIKAANNNIVSAQEVLFDTLLYFDGEELVEA